MTISFAVLGPLTVSDGARTVELGPSRPATLLAALLLNANSVVSPEALCRVVWDDRPPLNGRATVQTCMRRLRTLLAQFGLPENRIETTAGGYRFPADESELDLARFRELVRDAGRAEDLPAKVSLLREAMGLWRGRPLPNVRSDALGRDDVGQLIEEWLWAAEQTYAAELELGHHRELLPELRSVTAMYPNHEPLWRQLIEALYLTGRQADALGSFDRIRRHLDDSLGVTPSPMLQELQLRILRGEPVAPNGSIPPSASINASTNASPGPAAIGADSPVEFALPPRLADFVGRNAELDSFDVRLTGSGGLALLSGPPGIGKTALAVEAAHRFGERFPDGRFLVSSTSTKSLPAQVDELRQRRCLIVLDDVTDIDTLTAAVSPTSECATIVTSNKSLLALAVGGGAWSHRVAPLSQADGVAVLRRLLGEERADADPAAVAALAAWCGGHPGALRLVAARLLARPRLPLAEYRQSLEDEPEQVFAHGAGLQLPGADLRGYLDRLDPPAASAFLTLALSTGATFDLQTAADVLGIAPAHATPLLDDLVVANLVEEEHTDQYTVHCLLRHLGRGLATANTTRMDVI